MERVRIEPQHAAIHTTRAHSQILLLLLLTAIELSLGGSSPYTSTDKTNKNIYKKHFTAHQGVKGNRFNDWCINNRTQKIYSK